MRDRRVWFGAIFVACLVSVVAYVGAAASSTHVGSPARNDEAASLLAPTSVEATSTVSTAAATGTTIATSSSTPGVAPTMAPGAARMLFLDTATDPLNPHVAVASTADLGSRQVSGMGCQRVYFAGGSGLCLGGQRDFIYHDRASVFDASLHTRAEFDVSGLPSRTRVSRDGRYGATTVFVAGDSYGAAFSTRMQIVDMANGHLIGNLEDFVVTKDGKPFSAADFNFWGVTFEPESSRFYATLGTSGTTYLVEGDVRARTIRTVFEGVECPSLSPDAQHIGFKHREGADHWRLWVLDLATMQAGPVASETRSIDDQVEWLDDSHLLYAISRYSGSSHTWDTWVTSINSNEAPSVFLHDAYSPAVIR